MLWKALVLAYMLCCRGVGGTCGRQVSAQGRITPAPPDVPGGRFRLGGQRRGLTWSGAALCGPRHSSITGQPSLLRLPLGPCQLLPQPLALVFLGVWATYKPSWCTCSALLGFPHAGVTLAPVCCCFHKVVPPVLPRPAKDRAAWTQSRKHINTLGPDAALSFGCNHPSPGQGPHSKPKACSLAPDPYPLS